MSSCPPHSARHRRGPARERGEGVRRSRKHRHELMLEAGISAARSSCRSPKLARGRSPTARLHGKAATRWRPPAEAAGKVIAIYSGAWRDGRRPAQTPVRLYVERRLVSGGGRPRRPPPREPGPHAASVTGHA